MSLPTIGFVVVVNSLDESSGAYPDVQNFIDIYEDKVKRVVVFGPSEAAVSRDEVDVVTVPRSPPRSTPLRVLDYAWYQFRLAREVFRARKECDSMFFHVGGTALLLPLLVCRIAGLPTNVFVLGSAVNCYYGTHGRSVVSTTMVRFLTALQWVTCRIASRVLVLSDGMVTPADGRFWSAPRVTANLNYIDCDRFLGRLSTDERPYDIVYIGRFEGVKGVVNLAHAMVRLAERRPDVRICLVGDGSLKDDVERIVREGGVADQIDLVGWVDHDEIPSYFSESRLLVLPSESEGVPKSILEAMACETVPVATPVGGIPDIVDDGETGFLLPDNDPETIARTVDRVLNRDDLDKIAGRARTYVRHTHSYDATAEQFRRLLAADVEEETTIQPMED